MSESDLKFFLSVPRFTGTLNVLSCLVFCAGDYAPIVGMTTEFVSLLCRVLRRGWYRRLRCACGFPYVVSVSVLRPFGSYFSSVLLPVTSLAV